MRRPQWKQHIDAKRVRQTVLFPVAAPTVGPVYTIAGEAKGLNSLNLATMRCNTLMERHLRGQNCLTREVGTGIAHNKRSRFPVGGSCERDNVKH